MQSRTLASQRLSADVPTVKKFKQTWTQLKARSSHTTMVFSAAATHTVIADVRWGRQIRFAPNELQAGHTPRLVSR
jgi:hypothetical protein